MGTRGNRKQQILEALAETLENSPGERITIAILAKKVGVSEAALYRHFPSKARMFEGLIEFIEESLLTRATRISAEGGEVAAQCNMVLSVLLVFAERNPGLSRILAGDALSGETARLRQRVSQMFDRLALTVKQMLREGEIRTGVRCSITEGAAAALMLAVAQGKIAHFVRSDFKQKPTDAWDQQWEALSAGLFTRSPHIAQKQ